MAVLRWYRLLPGLESRVVIPSLFCCNKEEGTAKIIRAAKTRPVSKLRADGK